jgi:hypothetical protein
MIALPVAPKGPIKPRVGETFDFIRSANFKTCQPKSNLIRRAQHSEKDNQPLDSNTSSSDAAERNQLPPPPPPRRRSPVGRDVQVTQDDPEERDIFIPVLVILCLVAYGTTALIAWLEYQDF